MVGLCSMECNHGALTHKHFQMVFKGNFNSLLVFNKKKSRLFKLGREFSHGSGCLMQEVEG